MRIGLIDVDGHNFPNIPLMKISAWHKQQGDSVEWYSPMFVMFPSEYDGYYRIREFNNGGYEQRYIGYTPSGFKLVWQEDVQAPTIAFKLVWKAKDTVSGKSVKNVWRMPCKANNRYFCVGGWGCVRIEQTNAG